MKHILSSNRLKIPFGLVISALIFSVIFGALGLVAVILLVFGRKQLLSLWGSLSSFSRQAIRLGLDLLVVSAVLLLAEYPVQQAAAFVLVYLLGMTVLAGYRRGTQTVDFAALVIIFSSVFLGWSVGYSVGGFGQADAHLVTEHAITCLIYVPSILVLLRVLTAELGSISLAFGTHDATKQQSAILVLTSFDEVLARAYSDLARVRGYNLLNIWVRGPCRFSYVGTIPIIKNVANPIRVATEPKPVLLLVDSDGSAIDASGEEKFVRASKLLGYSVRKITSPAGGFGIKPLDTFDLKDLWKEIFQDRREFDLDLSSSILEINAPILITGGAGSIGSTLVEIFFKAGFTQLHILDNSELGIYKLSERFSEGFESGRISYYLADVTDVLAVQRVMSAVKPFAVFHAAANKHVSIVENNLDYAFQTNVIGTSTILDSLPKETCQFTLISTDKAVFPTNFMGATKRMAEVLVYRAANKQTTGTSKRYSIVRFGNVFGSSGSAPLKFIDQITEGKAITLTDEKMERFFMSIQEACYLVAEVSTNSVEVAKRSKGVFTYVLDMGQSIKIIELIKAMVGLSGKQIAETAVASNEIEVRVTGARPGEKLYEELSHDSELVASSISGVNIARNIEVGDLDLEAEFEQVLVDRSFEKNRFLTGFSQLLLD